MSCTCNGICNRILYNRLYDQRIPYLQGCLVEFYEEVVYIAMMKEVEKGLLDLALQQSRNVHSFEVATCEKRGLNKSQGTGL